jgi:uncharacterized cupin superfamily protein
LPAVELTRWPHDKPPTRSQLDAMLRLEKLAPSWWSNGPGDTYGAHSHSYNKVLYCAEGSVTFRVGDTAYELHSGDRLDIPSGTAHSAVVGPAGVQCLEARAQ